MNKLEKALVWALGWNYNEDDKVTIEIYHLVSSQKTIVGLEKTYTMNWLPFTLDITRPETGRLKLNYVCRHCGKSLAFNVTSRKTFKKIIGITAMTAVGIALIASLLILLDVSPMIPAILFALLFPAVGFLIIILPMEYKQNGIGYGLREYPDHPINYSHKLAESK